MQEPPWKPPVLMLVAPSGDTVISIFLLVGLLVLLILESLLFHRFGVY